MPIDKISFKANPVVDNKIENKQETRTPIVDNEKSGSMKKMLGLSLLAVASVAGILIYAKKGKVKPKSTTPEISTTSKQNEEPQKALIDLIKRADGTLQREIQKDENGQLTKIIKYAKDGKTVISEKVRESANSYIETIFGKNTRKSRYQIISTDSGKQKVVETERKIFAKDGRLRTVQTWKEQSKPLTFKKYDRKTGMRLIESKEWLYKEDGSLDSILSYGYGKDKNVLFQKIENPDGSVLLTSRNFANGKTHISERFDKDGNKLTRIVYDKKGNARIYDYKDGVTSMHKEIIGKNGEKYFYMPHSDSGKEISIYNSKLEPVGTVRFGRDNKPVSSSFKDSHGAKTRTIYDANGKRIKKIGTNAEGLEQTTLYDRFGQKTQEVIETQEETLTYKYKKGKLIELFKKDKNGTMKEYWKSYNTQNVKDMSVEYCEDGSVEILINLPEIKKTPSGLHYQMVPIKFDKFGNNVPHSYSNCGKIGDVNEVRQLLEEIGQGDLLKKYYHPNGQLEFNL